MRRGVAARHHCGGCRLDLVNEGGSTLSMVGVSANHFKSEVEFHRIGVAKDFHHFLSCSEQQPPTNSRLLQDKQIHILDKMTTSMKRSTLLISAIALMMLLLSSSKMVSADSTTTNTDIPASVPITDDVGLSRTEEGTTSVTPAPTLTTDEPPKDHDVCGKDQFVCNDFFGDCIPLEHVCDGKWDCADGRDEVIGYQWPIAYWVLTMHGFRRIARRLTTTIFPPLRSTRRSAG